MCKHHFVSFVIPLWNFKFSFSLQVEVRAVPIDMDALGDDYKRMRRLSRPDEGSLTFGGNPPPCLDTPYEVTVKDRKDAFHAICMMKVIFYCYKKWVNHLHCKEKQNLTIGVGSLIHLCRFTMLYNMRLKSSIVLYFLLLTCLLFLLLLLMVYKWVTVNFLNIRTPKRFVVITLKFELCGFTIE